MVQKSIEPDITLAAPLHLLNPRLGGADVTITNPDAVHSTPSTRHRPHQTVQIDRGRDRRHLITSTRLPSSLRALLPLSLFIRRSGLNETPPN
jgi:hypothetical protein